MIIKKCNIIHITRKIKKYAKAGNVNNYLYMSNLNINPSDYILFMDADNIIQPNGLKILYSSLYKNKKLAYVAGIQYYHDISNDLLFDPYSSNIDIKTSKYVINIYQLDTIHGTNLLIKRDVLNFCGGFPTFGVGEDVDLSCYVQTNGYNGKFISNIISYGTFPQNLFQMRIQRARWMMGQLFFF